ncbi:MAG: glutathione S-transferase family protein [Pseudomonadota bacterium]
MITIWGRTTSSNVQIAMWTIGELGLQHHRRDVGGAFGGLDTDAFGAMNPNRRIPVLEDGDLVLWESAAILRYLGAEYGDAAFWPADPAARARLDMWAEWVKTSVAPVLTYKVFWQLVRTAEAERNVALISEGTGQLAGLMPMVDARLSGQAYLGGDALSFADIVLGHMLYRYMTLPFERAATPALDAYYARLCERPAFAEHVMVSYESLRVTA